MKPMKNWKNPPPMKPNIFKPAIAEPDISFGNRFTGIVMQIATKPKEKPR
jgi:hypothetical protein